MSIAPQVFLCYGRADQDVAKSLARELWRQEIECYNYLAKPVEDRAVGELNHLSYIAPATLFIAVLSEDSLRRALVIEEILMADQFAALSSTRRRVYVHTAPHLNGFRLPMPDLVLEWNSEAQPISCTTMAQQAVGSILNLIGSATLARMRQAWQINKSLHPDAWQDLNASYVRLAS